ncbi:hypothetical protein KAI04_03300 [Candidatus Pacearchaeota archaeon]|nr:hypothetical protein [Candidatus Pacearchaeota archaeon]
MNPVIIFDASTLISFSMAGLIPEIRELKKIFKGKFIISEDVKKEAIDTPLKIKRFQLEALKIKQLLDENILELPISLGLDDKLIKTKTQEILDMANTTIYGADKDIHLIDLGESSALAISKILNDKKIENVIAIDERTTRSLAETPNELKKYLEGKLHAKMTVKQEKVDFFKQFKFIRSVELIYVAYKKGILKLKGSENLSAILYALKYKGCAVSGKEIQEIRNLA